MGYDERFAKFPYWYGTCKFPGTFDYKKYVSNPSHKPILSTKP